MGEWKFSDSPDVAVFADRSIFSRDDWIAYVSHMEDDGSWLFYGSDTRDWDERDIILVGLQ
ncbi:hypothetical protein, partial [Mesorhizobium sp. M2E.F.Ca.ET.209.01.1.1]